MADTEKRTGTRIAVNAAATLQVLGTSKASNGEPIPVRVSDASERGMRVQSGVRVDAGRAVRLEIGDTMFLGEVCYCAPTTSDPAALFHIGIVTEQCLAGLVGLHHLIKALEPEESRHLKRV